MLPNKSLILIKNEYVQYIMSLMLNSTTQIKQVRPSQSELAMGRMMPFDFC